MKYADLTENPSIFRKTYWGNFDAQDSDEEIIRNRDRFVRDYWVTKYVEPPNLYFTDKPEGFDHMEFYRTADGEILVLTSPYSQTADDSLRGAGFSRMPYRLYATNAVTYVRRFRNLASAKAWAKLICESAFLRNLADQHSEAA